MAIPAYALLYQTPMHELSRANVEPARRLNSDKYLWMEVDLARQNEFL